MAASFVAVAIPVFDAGRRSECYQQHEPEIREEESSPPPIQLLIRSGEGEEETTEQAPPIVPEMIEEAGSTCWALLRRRWSRMSSRLTSCWSSRTIPIVSTACPRPSGSSPNAKRKSSNVAYAEALAVFCAGDLSSE